MYINIVDKNGPRVFTAISLDDGVVLCDKERGAFITLRCAEDVENLKKLLNKIEIVHSF